MEDRSNFKWLTLGSNLVLLAAVIVLLVVVTRSEYRYSDGISAIETPWQLLYYWILPVGALLVLLGLLALDPPRRVNAALAICCTGAMLLLAEVSLRVLDGPRLSTHALAGRQLSVPFDERGLREVIRDLEETSSEPVRPSIAPAFLVDEGFRLVVGERRLLPLGGISRTLTVYCNETGEWVVYRSDEYGFHNPIGQHVNGVEVAMVGDSFAQGGCVDSSDNIAAMLRKHFGSLVNVGMGGSGPLLELAALVEYVVPLRPRIVLWLYYEGNDLRDLNDESQVAELMRIYESGGPQGLRTLQPEIDAELVRWLEERNTRIDKRSSVSRILVLDGLRKRIKGLLATAPAEASHSDLDPRRFVEILTRASRLTEEFGGSFHVVYLPAWKRYVGGMSDEMFFRPEVLRLMAEAGLSVIDVHERFDELEDPQGLFALGIEGHYNVRGYRRVSEAILSSLGRRSQDSVETRDLPVGAVAVE